MGSSILIIGDDGSVYQVKTSELGKIAKKVPKAKQSKAVQDLVEKAGTESKGSARIFVTKTDVTSTAVDDIFFTAGRAEIMTVTKKDLKLE
jgi:hypothetical protein